MTVSITATAANNQGTGSRLGYLVWWTLHRQEWDEVALKAAGKAAGVPQWMVDKIKGRNEHSAWLAATQLGAKGIPAQRLAIMGESVDDHSVRFVTRDITPDTRAVVREVVDRGKKVVGSVTVALLTFAPGIGITHQWIGSPSNALDVEIGALVEGMKNTYAAILGKVDDARVRAIVIEWLDRRYKVTVRGSGGVYLIPTGGVNNPGRQATIEAEAISIRNWLRAAPMESSFSIVEVSDAGATTVDTFQQAAIDELKLEMADVDAKLTEWAANPAMNAGSVAYSAGTMVERMAELNTKANFLIESLGDEIGVVGNMIGMLRTKAVAMAKTAQTEVDAYQAQKQGAANVAKLAKKLDKKAGVKPAVDAGPFDDVNLDGIKVSAPIAKAGKGGKKSGATKKGPAKL